MTLDGSTLDAGTSETRMGSKSACGGDVGILTGREGTGGQCSERDDFKDGRFVDGPGVLSTLGGGGGARVGHGGSCGILLSSSSRGIGGRGGLRGGDGRSARSSDDSSVYATASSGDSAGGASASCGVLTTTAPLPRAAARGTLMTSNAVEKWGSEMRTGLEGAYGVECVVTDVEERVSQFMGLVIDGRRPCGGVFGGETGAYLSTEEREEEEVFERERLLLLMVGSRI